MRARSDLLCVIFPYAVYCCIYLCILCVVYFGILTLIFFHALLLPVCPNKMRCFSGQCSLLQVEAFIIKCCTFLIIYWFINHKTTPSLSPPSGESPSGQYQVIATYLKFINVQHFLISWCQLLVTKKAEVFV